MKKQSKVETFWKSYLGSVSEETKLSHTSYDTWSFCDNEEAANKLGELVKSGIKTATCSLIWKYEVENEKLPSVGDLSIITNWEEEPLCIIETTETEVKAFNEVDDKFAFDEGEGNRSLTYWRKVHWDFFSRECSSIGRKPTETMPLLCERFRVIFLQ